MSTEPSRLSESELKDALAAASEALLEVNARRDATLATLAALQEESSVRRKARASFDYEEARRRAASNGSAPPPPPRAMTVPVVSAAASRLLSMTMPALTRPAAAAPHVPVGGSRPVADDRDEEMGTVVRGVSDHAVVRYLERVVGVDMDSIRSRIMTPTVELAIRSGVTRIRLAEGVIVATDGMITTFLPSDAGHNRRKGRYVDRGRTQRRPTARASDLENWSAEID